jgi:kynurenine--oxoglutarate transaminase/cysteine-S-conjugate beta-lyase/glutamine--phenylpyruvate transaminase
MMIIRAMIYYTHAAPFLTHSLRAVRGPTRRSFVSSSLSAKNDGGNTVLSPRLEGLDYPTVWHEFSPLAVEYGAVNLGQGFPDWDPPSFVVEAMIKATDPQHGRQANQYARSFAHLPLAEVLSQDYSHQWSVDIDPVTQVATAVGCTNALYCALQGLLAPGDEVLLLEPAFDIYFAQVQMAGARPIYCPLRPVDTEISTMKASEHFRLDLDELEACITPRTKVLLLNTPHNPTGKMFSRQELTDIANMLQHHPQITVISDEVYQHIVLDDEPHVSMATIPGMWDRTLTLSSSGKTFSCTGWKVGWAIGPPHLVKAVTAVQQWVNFSVPTPNQDAIAQAMERAREPYEGFDNYYLYLQQEYRRKRQLLISALSAAKMTPIIPPGGFFIMAETSHIDFPYNPDEVTVAMPAKPMPRDWSLSRWLTREVGVTAIPPSAFYCRENRHLAKDMLRFAFCKGDNTILEARTRFQSYFGQN